eukprot:g6826.t1
MSNKSQTLNQQYQLLTGKLPQGRLAWDRNALQKKVHLLRATTTTINNVTNNNYYSKPSPQTQTKAKNPKKVENALVESTAKVKELSHLLARRSEKKGIEQVLHFDKLYNSMSKKEQEEVSQILTKGNLFYSFPRLQQQVAESEKSIKAVESVLRDTLQSNPECQKAIIRHVEETKQLLNDVPEVLQEKVCKLVLETTQKHVEKLSLLPLYNRQRSIVDEYESSVKNGDMEKHEQKISAINRRITRRENELQEEYDPEELQKIQKELTEAKQQLWQLQSQRNNTRIKKSTAKKRKASDLWNQVNPRKVRFHKEAVQRGLKLEKQQDNNIDNVDNNDESYATAVKKTTETGILARLLGYS